MAQRIITKSPEIKTTRSAGRTFTGLRDPFTEVNTDACEAREPSLIQSGNKRLRHLIERVGCSVTAVRAGADLLLGQLPDTDEPGNPANTEFDGEASELHHLISILESRQSELEYQVRRYERL